MHAEKHRRGDDGNRIGPDVKMRDSATYLTFKEFIGRCPLSPSTIRRRIKDGSIPHVQPGGKGHRVLIPENAMDLLCAVQAVDPEITKETPTSVGVLDDGVADPAPEPPREEKLPGPAPDWKKRMRFRS